MQYRVLVSTDLGGDPDDMQSLVHLLHYSDILKVEGLISTYGPGSVPKAEGIREWVLRTDLDFLRQRGHSDLMTESEVLPLIKQGSIIPRAPAKGADTEGSRWIVDRAMAPDPLGQNRPLWILGWGAMTDIAQALHDEPRIAEKIRINYIGSNNTKCDIESRDYVYNGMAKIWPNLWWIEDGLMPPYSHDTFRGYYAGGNQEGEWNAQNFIEVNIRGKGTTHAGMFEQKLGDAFPVAEWPRGSLKEGDTPTFLYLLSPVVAGIGDVNDPTSESWGGSYCRPKPNRYPNYYTDLDQSTADCQFSIAKWKVDFLSHWKKRWAWYES